MTTINHTELAKKYEKQGDFPNMIKHYELAISKGDVLAMFDLGLYYCFQKDYRKRAKYWSMVME
jgi:hypothetical protein